MELTTMQCVQGSRGGGVGELLSKCGGGADWMKRVQNSRKALTNNNNISLQCIFMNNDNEWILKNTMTCVY